MCLLCLVTMCSCAWGENYEQDPTNLSLGSVEPSRFITITVQGIPMTLDMQSNRFCQEIPLMTTEFPMDFQMGEYNGWDITIDGVQAKSGELAKVQVETLSKDIAVIIRYKNQATGETGEQYIRTLPNAITDYNVISNVSDGVYYYAHDGYALKMDHEGKIIFYYCDPNSTARYINEFKKTEINQKTYYLIAAIHNSHQYPSLAVGAGPNSKEIILDENYHVVDTVKSLYKTDRTPADIPLDQHEFLMLDKDHYVLLGYVPERVNNIPDTVEHSKFGARIVSTVIQEVKDGKVIFEWYSSDYPELYEYSTEQNDFYNEECGWSDYAHCNSVDIDPDDHNFFCSFRQLEAMLKIDRQTGDIIWVLSGVGDMFGLEPEQKTSRQHDIRKIGPSTYSVFDNGYDNGQTRIVEYTLDEESKELVSFREHYIEKMFSPYQGNAQKIDGSAQRYVFSSGMWLSKSLAFFYDIDFATNEILFEAVPAESNAAYDMVYRAYRFDS